jgi:hypothetical protein
MSGGDIAGDTDQREILCHGVISCAFYRAVICCWLRGRPLFTPQPIQANAINVPYALFIMPFL